MVLETLLPFLIAVIGMFSFSAYKKYKKMERQNHEKRLRERVQEIHQKNGSVELSDLVNRANALARSRMGRDKKS